MGDRREVGTAERGISHGPGGGPRIVVAGQTPPPMGGQNVMIRRAVELLRSEPSFRVDRLPFHFTMQWATSQRATLAKVVELVRVLGRLLRLRLDGRIDCLIYPLGGPSLVPIVRDLVLLPACYLAARTVVLHIHAGGIAEALPRLPRPVALLARAVYGRSDAAIVLTDFSRVDADSLGIERVEVIPNTLEDAFRPDWVERDPSMVTLLYVGHLCEAKGTPQLLEAFAALHARHPETRLVLIGEPLRPYRAEELVATIDRLELNDAVAVEGVVVGEDKWRWFGRADLFVFPSVAPESFPLVLLEAMMWGVPVIATDWRAHAEVLGDLRGGICFDIRPDVASALADALEKAMRDRDEWAAWGDIARRRYLDLSHPGRLTDFVRQFVGSLPG